MKTNSFWLAKTYETFTRARNMQNFRRLSVVEI